MNVNLLKALVALALVSGLFVWSVVTFGRCKTAGSVLQLLGAGCLIVVVLTHIAEVVHILPWMRWGEPDSAGHYLDLASAVLGVTLLPAGYFLHRRECLSAIDGSSNQ